MKKLFCFIALGMAVLPALAFAAGPNIWPTGYWGPLVSCTGNPVNLGTNGATSDNGNACKSLCDLIQTFENFVYFGISIVVFIISPILFAWGGIMFMISRGKPEGISKAKSILTGGLVGLLIVLCAWLIVNTLVTTLKITGVGGFGTSGSCTAPAAPSTS